MIGHVSAVILITCKLWSACERVQALECIELWIRRLVYVLDYPPLFDVETVD